MNAARTDSLLDTLEACRKDRPAGGAQAVERLLARLEGTRIPDAARLVRLHDALLFLRAYPHSKGVLGRVERLLAGFIERVRHLERKGEDLAPLDEIEVAGIAGRPITMAFSYDIARWLRAHAGRRAEIDLEDDEGSDRLGEGLPRFLPLLSEEARVDSGIPFAAWLRAARGSRGNGLGWLLDRFERLAIRARERAELYDALGLFIRWEPEGADTRTRMARREERVFFHRGPLLTRRDVSLAAELSGPPLPLRRLTRRDGERILDMARAAEGVRYRELYAFTYGDPSRILAAQAGRGVELFLTGVPQGRRLPLRAVSAVLILKNGVPVGYAEGLALFERIEVAFNVFYAFRDGESAWLYARALRLYRQALGVTAFAIDPYQIGHRNEEGITSGAFWFYRKLGFRAVDPAIETLARREETRSASNPAHRTSARVLRQLAEEGLLFEATRNPGGWDGFHVRNLGLAVQRRMARHGGDAGTFHHETVERVARLLNLKRKTLSEAEHRAFDGLALVFDLIPRLDRWTREERVALVAIVRAKAGADEARYLRLLARHERLRGSLMRLGSRG